MKTSAFLCCTAIALIATGPAHAQGAPAAPEPGIDSALQPNDVVDFSADGLTYDNDADIVTATGAVRMTREGNKLKADRVIWNRVSGEVRATGNVAVTNPDGDTAYGDSIALTDSLKDGVIENLLLVLADGGRLAATHAVRKDGIDTLDEASYSPCPVIGTDGCPKQPLWQITALKVVHNPARHRIYYTDARLRLLGVPILWLPHLSHPDGSGGGGPGLLVPNFQYNHTNGAEFSIPYYIKFSSARDLTVTPHVFSAVAPMLEAEYRELNSLGAFKIGGFLTYGSRLPAEIDVPVGTPTSSDIRGYLYGSGHYQLSPDWSISGALRLTADRTFLRRYGISNDDRLRNTIEIERITHDSYLSIAGWAVQTLRVGDVQGQQAIALPAIDFRQRVADPLLGGQFELQANSLAILRTAGEDTQRAFASVRWDLRKLTPLGQEITFTAYGRGDIYHATQIEDTATAIYRGEAGWHGRGIGALAIDVRWPFIGTLFDGTQRLTPRVQIVGSPSTPNLAIPNEDARAVDLEDSNLFALNRFPGYDRWEDGARITYGLEWNYDRPRLAIRSIIGQSYRFTDAPSSFPIGTGLSTRTSDIVGRTTVSFGDLISFTHRYRLDKDTLAIRRNEIDTTIGSHKTYVTAGYLRLDRNLATNIEDLRNHEEVRLGGRVQFARYWSIFGSTVIDLTGRNEDPLSLADGYEPLRHRIGVAYEDSCLEFGLTWRRDYDQTGDARSGNSFMLRLALKNLGR